MPSAKPLASYLHEYSVSRTGWTVSYFDVDPASHAEDLDSLRSLAPAEQASHPLFKTRICQAPDPCPRGSACPFAHGPGEMRSAPSQHPQSYTFSLLLHRPDGNLEFCNFESHPQKSEAKTDLAAQCISALGLKVSGQTLVCAAGAVPAQPPAATRAADAPTIPTWQKRQLLEIVSRLNKEDKVQVAAQQGYEKWVSCIGGTFGSAQPQLARVMRTHYGTFRNFVTVHAGQVPHPMPASGGAAASSAAASPSQPATASQAQPAAVPQASHAAAGPAALSAFYDSLRAWIMRPSSESGARWRIGAAELGVFYATFPQYAAFKGEWKPGKHCERDGLLVWAADPAAAGGGWIELPASVAEDETINWLTGGSTTSSLPFGDWCATQTSPHPIIMSTVQEAGSTGIDVRTLRTQLEQLEPILRVRRTIKTRQLIVYVKSFPSSLRMESHNAAWGDNRVYAILAEQASHTAPGPPVSSHSAAEEPLGPPTRQGLMAAAWEFLFGRGIDTQTAQMMTSDEMVELGLSHEAAVATVAHCRYLRESFDGDVYADLVEEEVGHRESPASHREVALRQQLDALSQRCSDLQRRVSVLEEARMCVICMEQRRDTVVMPCMHAMFCNRCLRGPAPATCCPTCRGPIAGLVECRLDMLDEEVEDVQAAWHVSHA